MYLNTVSAIVLGVDMLSHFNTVYYEQGEPVLSRIKIASNYISGEMVIDLVSLVPILTNSYLMAHQEEVSY